MRPGRDSAPDRRLRPLDEPHPIDVRADAGGIPVAVRRGRHLVPVAAVRETWRIDDEWWRRSISRMYHALVLAGGVPVTIFQDLETGRWYGHG